MYSKSFALAALASTVTAQSLTDVLANQSSLSNLTTYLQGFPDLVSQLGNATNITLLAPNNNAFSQFLNSSLAGALTSDLQLVEGILQYHVLNGTHSTFANTSFVHTHLQPPQYTNVTGGQVVEAIASGNSTSFYSGLLSNSSSVGQPLNFSGGYIHIIDRLLTIPSNATQTLLSLNLTAAAGALDQLDLADRLDSLSDLTLFIPTNAAFASIASVLNSTNTTALEGILGYHAIAGSVVYSTDIRNDTSIAASSGTNLTLRVEDGNVYVNNAKVVLPNVLIANGVIHVIDEVLNPANTTLQASPTATEPAFAGATSASDIPFTSGVTAASSIVPTSSIASAQSSEAAGSTSSAFAARQTGAIGAAALFGGAAVLMNM